MPCYRPLRGFYSKDVNESGKRSLVFTSDRSLIGAPVDVPCGQCIGCRLDRSLMWAVRCVHEASLYEDNCFVTLTFDEAHLDKEGSLRSDTFPLFMKRLRQFIVSHRWDKEKRAYVSIPESEWIRGGAGVRFFHCGEYGAGGDRPHHHACLFGLDFKDKYLWSVRGGVKLYRSPALEQVWGNGFSTVGEVTFESAAYVARYVLKKWSNDQLKGDELYDAMVSRTRAGRAKYAYDGLVGRDRVVPSVQSVADVKTLSYEGRLPEFVTMSRRPGIGADWFAQYYSDVFPHGYVVLPSGVKVNVPDYYETKFSLDSPFLHAKLKAERCARARENPHNAKHRLSDREQVKKLTINILKREFEK